MLEKINLPDDIKGLSQKELSLLAEEIRAFLIENVTRTGGHLSSNLGAVELTLALHRSFDFTRDHLIFDVGHQSYTHKILTGRKDTFSSLRQRGGISGFTKISESKYDAFGAGHSSTSVSSAIGFAESDKIKGSDAYTVAVLGDGAFTGGMVHEALNNCKKDLNLIIILNENEMSISKNIGSFAELIARIRATRGYLETKRRTASFVKRIPLLGARLFATLRDFKKNIKNRIYKSNYFEDLGLYYLGPVDGHDTESLERLLNEAKRVHQSTVIHVKTVKGKGYAPAEQNPGMYHGVLPLGKERLPSFSRRAGDLLLQLGRADSRICAVTAAMADGTGMTAFAEAIPERFFDVGIAEEHALTFCAGLAANGMKPFFAVYSSFLQRGYDNLLHDIALQSLSVTVLIDRAGISAADGPTHHGIFDVAFLSQIPNTEIYTPSSFASLSNAMNESVMSDKLVAIRYSNCDEPKSIGEFTFSRGNVKYNYSSDDEPEYLIITYGKIVDEAVISQRLMTEKKKKCGVILLEKLKPYVNTAMSINEIIPKTAKAIVFLEEGIKNGGAGMIIKDSLTLPQSCRYVHLGIDDLFDTDKNSGNIYTDFGIGREDIISAFEKTAE